MRETIGFELTSTITLVLQANQLTKCTSHPNYFTDNIWDADLADMQLISKFNKEFNFSYVLLIFIVNMHGLFLTITNAFQKMLNE